MSKKQSKKLLTPEILKQALLGAVKKLDPRYMINNPVMFVVEVGFFITLLLTIVPGLFGETDSSLRTYNRSRGAQQATGRQSDKDAERHRGPSSG